MHIFQHAFAGFIQTLPSLVDASGLRHFRRFCIGHPTLGCGCRADDLWDESYPQRGLLEVLGGEQQGVFRPQGAARVEQT